jgi:HlyD family secretion protein
MTDIPIVVPWWRRNYWLPALAVLTLGVATAMTLPTSALRTIRRSADALSFATVERGVYQDWVMLRCTVVPRDVIYLDAAEGGRVERVLVQPGDAVIPGQLLVVLSNTELELEVMDRQSRLIDSITQLQTYQTQLEQNRFNNEKALQQLDFDVERLTRNLARVDALAERGLASRESQDNAREQLNQALALRPLQARSNQQQSQLRLRQLPVIDSQIVALQRDIEMTRGKLQALQVRAPRDGRMTAIDLKEGQTLARGERLGEMTPNTGYQLTARVDEFYLDQVAQGQRALLQLGGGVATLHVQRVHPEVREGGFAIDLEFDGALPEGLRPGQALQPRLLLGKDRAGLVLRTGAFLEVSGGRWVFVRRPNTPFAERRTVSTGRRNAEQVEVLGGLRAGESVLISDYADFEHVDRIELE